MRGLVIHQLDSDPRAGCPLRHPWIARDVATECAFGLVVPETRPCLADAGRALNRYPQRLTGGSAGERERGASRLCMAGSGYRGIAVHIGLVGQGQERGGRFVGSPVRFDDAVPFACGKVAADIDVLSQRFQARMSDAGCEQNGKEDGFHGSPVGRAMLVPEEVFFFSTAAAMDSTRPSA